MDGLRQLARRLEPEVRGHGVLEARAGAAAVLAARGCEHGGPAQVVSPTPVPGDLAECRKPCVPAVRRDTDAVDAGAARDGDSPATLRAGAQDGKRVVADVHATRPSALLDGLAHGVLLCRKVDAGEQQRRDVGDLTAVVAEPGVVDRVGQQPIEHGDAAVDAEVLR